MPDSVHCFPVGLLSDKDTGHRMHATNNSLIMEAETASTMKTHSILTCSSSKKTLLNIVTMIASNFIKITGIIHQMKRNQLRKDYVL
jgi:hypothetical protein